MNMKLIGAYVTAILSGLVALAAALLIVLQWGNTGDFSLFGKNIKPATVVIVLGSIAFGAALPYLIRLLWRSSQTIRRHRQAADVVRKAAEQAVRQASPASATEVGNGKKTGESALHD
ncbi:hypothetical protein LCGC14_0452630 [marine sediment metagenome]|uniref:Lipopolysaccharide assembly protein A domain-containing protein n=1 Tax=marine sediment metagenome TaxID=412755 RepID=A0A0F9T0P9_9ZZZZ|nr:hypothetical protein [Phycisphaerae bacterium]